MQRHHGTLAEADERKCRRRKLAAREFALDEFLQDRSGFVDAGPALVGVAEGQRKPLAARRRLAAGLDGVRRHKRGIRQQRLP
jgi:hypothetical protein